MKTSSIFKLTIFLVLSFFANASFAQITTTGMAIQGIARDASNNAITNSDIGLRFTVHYTNLSNSNVDLSPVTVSVRTDAFGVFSYVLDLSSIENSLFYDFQMKLKIEQTSPTTATISDENLNFVPYAASALNGVPTGTIMSYVGTTAPRGWALCDGSSIPVNPLTQTLRTLLGSNNTPDLRGMFLRGAGTNTNSTYVGPPVKTIQTDGIKSHLHEVDITTSTNGSHTHTYSTNGEASTEGDGAAAWNITDGGEGSISDYTIPAAGNHNHRVVGTTANNTGGLGETRPVNYGVTYIIKL